MVAANELIGVGIYTVPDAHRLSGVASARIRRWLVGYRYANNGQFKQSPPKWQRQLPLLHGEAALGFLDLMEVRVVSALRERGISWQRIRQAQSQARTLFGTDHPFADDRFRTDGRDLFYYMDREAANDRYLVNLAKSQFAFEQVIKPYFINLDFVRHQAARWWPLGQNRGVVVDPRRSFGQPIVNDRGIPTAVLAEAFRAEGSADLVARWYGVDIRAVRDATEFEDRLAA